MEDPIAGDGEGIPSQAGDGEGIPSPAMGSAGPPAAAACDTKDCKASCSDSMSSCTEWTSTNLSTMKSWGWGGPITHKYSSPRKVPLTSRTRMVPMASPRSSFRMSTASTTPRCAERRRLFSAMPLSLSYCRDWALPAAADLPDLCAVSRAVLLFERICGRK